MVWTTNDLVQREVSQDDEEVVSGEVLMGEPKQLESNEKKSLSVEQRTALKQQTGFRRRRRHSSVGKIL